MNKAQVKQALISFLIGAIVAFITTFLEGALEYFQGMENNVLGGAVAAIRHFAATVSQR